MTMDRIAKISMEVVDADTVVTSVTYANGVVASTACENLQQARSWVWSKINECEDAQKKVLNG